MGLEYFLYNTGYTNTLVERSNTSFAPSPPYKEILIDYFIPKSQPLKFYRESGGTIVLNNEADIENYIINTQITGATSPNESVYQFQFTGFTGVTLPSLYYNKIEIDAYSASTKQDIDTRIYRSGDTMTGSLSTSGNLTAGGAVTGTSMTSSVLITTPILNATSSITTPVISASTCVTTSISCASTRIQSPVICGSTCAIAPVICGSSYVDSPVVSGDSTYVGMCLCTYGSANINGVLTAASDLNVSGATRFADGVYLNAEQSGGTTGDHFMFWNPNTCQVLSKRLSGASDNIVSYDGNGNLVDSGINLSLITGGTGYYVYGEKDTDEFTVSDTPILYLSTGDTLTEGIFSVDYNALLGNGVKGKTSYVQFYLDGSPISDAYAYEPINNNDVFPISYMMNTYLTAGAHTFSVYYYAGAGNALMGRAAIRVKKIG